MKKNSPPSNFGYLLENLPDGIATSDLNGKITYCNKAFEELTGYSLKELRNLDYLDITPKQWHEFEKKIVDDLIQEKTKSFLYEKEYIRKNGKIIPIRLNTQLLYDENEKPIGLWASVREIGTWKETEESLKRQLKEITVLHEITTAGTESTSVDEFITRTTRFLSNNLYPHNFGFLPLTDDGKYLKVHPSYIGIPEVHRKEIAPIVEGITGKVVRTGKPQRIADISQDTDYIEFNSKSQSELAVPVIVNGKIFGVINTESKELNAYMEDDERLLTTLANQLASSIEKLQLFEAIQRQTSELSALYETAVCTSSILETDKLLEALYEQVKKLFPLDTFMVSSYDGVEKTLTILYAVEEEKPLVEWMEQTFPLTESGLSGWVVENKQPLLVKDLQSDKTPAPPKHGQKPARAWLGVPLTSHGFIIGMISVQSFTPNVFDENHQRLLESMAAQAANALENARLVEQTQERLNKLSTLHDIDLMVNSSLDLRVTLNILVDQLVEKLEVDAAAVMLLNAVSNMLEYAAGRGFRTRAIENYSLPLGQGLSGQAAMERHLVQALNLSELENDSTYLPLLQEEGFICFYSVPLIAKGQVKGVLDLFNRDIFNPTQEWINFLETLAGQAAIAIDNTTLLEDLQRSNIELTLAYDTTLEGWSRALDLRDRETEGHTQRVVDMTLRMAQISGFDEEKLVHLRRGALLHDIGKMGISDTILLKPGPLTDEEWEEMHKHPTYAYDLLYPIVHLRPAIDIPYCHHEKWDGSGYPRGLKGEQIPLAARIFAVVDVWDALTSDRPYRKAWSAKKALEEIARSSGSHFDPKVVELFQSIIKNELMK